VGYIVPILQREKQTSQRQGLQGRVQNHIERMGGPLTFLILSWSPKEGGGFLGCKPPLSPYLEKQVCSSQLGGGKSHLFEVLLQLLKPPSLQ
jgi:hypothetical protein